MDMYLRFTPNFEQNQAILGCDSIKLPLGCSRMLKHPFANMMSHMHIMRPTISFRTCVAFTCRQPRGFHARLPVDPLDTHTQLLQTGPL